MIAAIVAILTASCTFWIGFHMGRADGEKRAAFDEAFRKAGGK
jgi:hypothetical protein